MYKLLTNYVHHFLAIFNQNKTACKNAKFGVKNWQITPRNCVKIGFFILFKGAKIDIKSRIKIERL